MWSICTLQHYLIIKRNEALTLAMTWVNHENMMLGERSQTRKATLCDSIDTKCPEQIHPQGQKPISLVLRAGAGKKGSDKTTDRDEVIEMSTHMAETLIRLCDCPKNQ